MSRSDFSRADAGHDVRSLQGDIALSIVADNYRFVVGVDTHAATHTYALGESPSGKELGTETFPTTTAGLNRAVAWLGRRTGGDIDGVLISAEGTGSYGAVMADILSETGYRVVEAPAPSAKRLRGTAKTDTLDAIVAARSTLVMDVQRLRDRRAGKLQAALKVLTVAREQMNADRLRSINAPTALLRTHHLDLDARRALTLTQIRSVAAWRRRQEPLSLFVARADAVRHAKRVIHLDTDPKKQPRAGHEAGQRPCSGAAGHDRRRRRHRRGHHNGLVPPRPRPLSGRAGPDRWHLPDPGIIRQHHPAPPEPRRRPATEPGHQHHRAHPNAHGPRHPRLRPAPHPRRANQAGDHPMPETLRHPADTPDAHSQPAAPDRLTNIEASRV